MRVKHCAGKPVQIPPGRLSWLCKYLFPRPSRTRCGPLSPLAFSRRRRRWSRRWNSSRRGWVSPAWIIKPGRRGPLITIWGLYREACFQQRVSGYSFPSSRSLVHMTGSPGRIQTFRCFSQSRFRARFSPAAVLAVTHSERWREDEWCNLTHARSLRYTRTHTHTQSDRVLAGLGLYSRMPPSPLHRCIQSGTSCSQRRLAPCRRAAILRRFL